MICIQWWQYLFACCVCLLGGSVSGVCAYVLVQERKQL